MMQKNGIITDIQRFSIHDGPGIRTTVFLKGCPLDCVWCHNPETKKAASQLFYIQNLCVNCMACVQLCKSAAHFVENGIHAVDFSKCERDFKCVEECPTGALSVSGRLSTCDEVISVVLRDKSYYENSGGGMTISGGEPLFQPRFTLELLRAAKENGVSAAVETCGYGEWEWLEQFAGYTELFLFDFKESDPARHKQFTGKDNSLIMSNFDRLYSRKAKLRLRCPIIPGYNDTEAHFKNIADISKRYPLLDGVEIMPYHDIGRSKAQSIGAGYEVEGKMASKDMKDLWVEQIESFGGRGIR